MKTKLLLFALAFGLMSSTCSTDEVETLNDCNCEEQFYIKAPIVGGGGFTYEFIYARPIAFDCVNEEYNVYYPVSNVNYNTAKVVCE